MLINWIHPNAAIIKSNKLRGDEMIVPLIFGFSITKANVEVYAGPKRANA